MSETEKAEAGYEIEGGWPTWFYVCSECHGAIDPKAERCPHCGRKINWDKA